MKLTTLSSSSDYTEVSLTIKGIFVAFIPLLLSVGGQFGLSEVTDTELVNLIEAVTAAISACMIAFGLLRKLYLKLR